MPTYICRDCGHEGDYDATATLVREAHNREMRCGRELAVGDVVQHNGVSCEVLELYENGSGLVRPLARRDIAVTVEYRIAKAELTFKGPIPRPKEKKK